MAQIVYYFTSAHAVSELSGSQASPSFVVPSGNFGNIFAGWAAKRMGLDVDRLVVASNTNDILTRFFTSSTMAIEQVVPTTSPSMDIQVSSNLERLIFEVYDRNGPVVAELFDRFRSSGSVTVSGAPYERLRAEFDAASLDDRSVAEVIARYWREDQLLLDPHTAVGVGVAERLRSDLVGPILCLGTAHPAKFGDAVEAATGQHPPLPATLADLLERPERVLSAPNDLIAIEELVDSLRTEP
jgi:threonine synthase